MSKRQQRETERLKNRDDFHKHQWEEVVRLEFKGGKFCYVDSFGRVIWFDHISSLEPTPCIHPKCDCDDYCEARDPFSKTPELPHD